VRRYEPALDLAGDAVRGREVFRGNCAVCHKIGDVGHAVGPDLTSTSARDPKALLTHILDPSQYVPPNYLQYVVEDVNGRLHTGLLTAQSATSVTVTRDEGRSETILRSDIESLTSTAKSMMPEGFEDKIPPAAMADLLAYLRSTHAGGGLAPPTLDAGTLPGLVEPE
jgi:putative heme-binding domain-containing protein